MEPEWQREDPNKRGARRSTLFTGLRQREAIGLTWERLDRSRGVVQLEMTKSGRRREVPLNSKAGVGQAAPPRGRPS
jgi:integrase